MDGVPFPTSSLNQTKSWYETDKTQARLLNHVWNYQITAETSNATSNLPLKLKISSFDSRYALI